MKTLAKILGIGTIAFMFAAGLVQAEVKVGGTAPGFTLVDTGGQEYRLSDYNGKYVVLEWFNYDCPFVKKHYGSGNMQRLQEKYTGQDIIWLSINSSAQGKQGNYPPAEMGRMAQERNVHSTAVLLDPSGDVGRMYGAQTTPHIFIINPEGKLIYQGAIDSIAGTDPAEIADAENYVESALMAAMAGEQVKMSATKSYGCSVKY